MMEDTHTSTKNLVLFARCSSVRPPSTPGLPHLMARTILPPAFRAAITSIHVVIKDRCGKIAQSSDIVRLGIRRRRSSLLNPNQSLDLQEPSINSVGPQLKIVLLSHLSQSIIFDHSVQCGVVVRDVKITINSREDTCV